MQDSSFAWRFNTVWMRLFLFRFFIFLLRILIIFTLVYAPIFEELKWNYSVAKGFCIEQNKDLRSLCSTSALGEVWSRKRDFLWLAYSVTWNGPTSKYKLKFNNRNARCAICLKLTIKTAERSYWRRTGVFFVNLEHISHLFLVLLLLTLKR